MQFGPDGYLYISSGDGYDYNGTPQDLDSLLGKVLRISPRPEISGAPYTSPATNPYVGVPGANEIWSYGLRNPWRFSFDRLTGALDPRRRRRDHNWEEINYDPAPNAGRGGQLRLVRGVRASRSTASPALYPRESVRCSPAIHRPLTPSRTPSGRCAITGGYVARDPSLGDLYGRYLFADLCTGQVYSAALDTPTDAPTSGPSRSRSRRRRRSARTRAGGCTWPRWAAPCTAWLAPRRRRRAGRPLPAPLPAAVRPAAVRPAAARPAAATTGGGDDGRRHDGRRRRHRPGRGARRHMCGQSL